jgi:hypothetical protein
MIPTQMSQLPTLCGECEDNANLVTEENGVSVDYYVLPNVRLKVFLHHACVAGWSYKFALPLPRAKYLN